MAELVDWEAREAQCTQLHPAKARTVFARGFLAFLAWLHTRWDEWCWPYRRWRIIRMLRAQGRARYDN